MPVRVLDASPIVGIKPESALAVTNLNLNSANTWLMLQFVANGSVTLNTVRAVVSAVTGTLGSSDSVCELWSMPSGLLTTTNAPGSLIESRSTVTTVPTGAISIEFTGFTTALTNGEMYALIFKNANGSPASNFPQYRFCSGNNASVLGLGARGWHKVHTTDAGSSWVSQVGGVMGVRLGFSNGTYVGLDLSNAGPLAVANGVYSTREAGAYFASPSSYKLNIVGAGCLMNYTGSPTGKPRFKIYKGSTLVASTPDANQRTNAGTAQAIAFDSTVTTDLSSVYRIVLGESTQSDTSGNRFNLYGYTISNSSENLELLPLGGWKFTLWDGSSWAETDTIAPAIYLILDGTTPYTVPTQRGGFF